MMRFLLTLIALLPLTASASLPLQATLEEMAQAADHILIGHVTGVDMIDGHGRPITDDSARTGPGLDNVIRLAITVDEVLVTNASEMPKVLHVPLDNFMHFSLGQIRLAHQNDTLPRLILLKGENFVGIKSGIFQLPLEDRERVMEIHRATHPIRR